MAGKKGKSKANAHTGEALIGQCLERLSAILLRTGLDSPAAERLLRRSFVLVANRIARANGGSVTQSQIASMAGISRLEVRKTLETARTNPSGDIGQGNSRIEQLVHGWRTDRQYLDKKGKPIPLDHIGAGSKFDALVKKYGRDVTKKTLRVQLLTKGYVVERANKLILRGKVPSSLRPSAALSDLRFIASQLGSIDFELGRRAYQSKRVSIAASDRKSVLALRQIAGSRLQTVLSSLASMSADVRPNIRPRSAAKLRLIVNATIAIETEEGE